MRVLVGYAALSMCGSIVATYIYRVSTKERNLSNVIPVQKHCVLSWTPGMCISDSCDTAKSKG